MDFGQGVEATGREPECVCAPCVNSLLNLHMFLFPVTCRFEVGGREAVAKRGSCAAGSLHRLRS